MAVKEEALNQDLVIAPGEVMTDDELALVQSLSLAFPGAALRGCHFHFTQCLWRKVQKLGLAEDYREKDETVKANNYHLCLENTPSYYWNLW